MRFDLEHVECKIWLGDLGQRTRMNRMANESNWLYRTFNISGNLLSIRNKWEMSQIHCWMSRMSREVENSGGKANDSLSNSVLLSKQSNYSLNFSKQNKRNSQFIQPKQQDSQFLQPKQQISQFLTETTNGKSKSNRGKKVKKHKILYFSQMMTPHQHDSIATGRITMPEKYSTSNNS